MADDILDLPAFNERDEGRGSWPLTDILNTVTNVTTRKLLPRRERRRLSYLERLRELIPPDLPPEWRDRALRRAVEIASIYSERYGRPGREVLAAAAYIALREVGLVDVDEVVARLAGVSPRDLRAGVGELSRAVRHVSGYWDTVEAYLARVFPDGRLADAMKVARAIAEVRTLSPRAMAYVAARWTLSAIGGTQGSWQAYAELASKVNRMSKVIRGEYALEVYVE